MPQDVKPGIDTVSVWQGDRKRGNDMVKLHEKELAREGKTGMSSSPWMSDSVHGQVFLQVEGIGSQKNRFLVQKVFYGGCMTGRSQLATSVCTQDR